MTREAYRHKSQTLSSTRMHCLDLLPTAHKEQYCLCHTTLAVIVVALRLILARMLELEVVQEVGQGQEQEQVKVQEKVETRGQLMECRY